LVDTGEVQIVMLLSMLDTVPSYMTHVVEVTDMQVGPKRSRAEYLSSLPDFKASPFAFLSSHLKEQIAELPVLPVANLTIDGHATDEIISIRDLSLPLPDTDRVLYGGLSWTVRRGEHWALQGRNGSGKSTLLSLICADHPAAYACDISLFGRRRGTGESIWEIKKHIGFVSPEFHRAYKENRPAIDIVASGLHDSVGLYKRPRPDQVETCLFWMRVFGIEHLRDRMFLTLSSGEQRLCLLARAFVKDPALLILDEPLHGLDTYRRHLVRDVIDTFCRRPDKTLIMVSHYEEELPANITHRLVL
jgi:molybdate transport system ATP-binding protein